MKAMLSRFLAQLRGKPVEVTLESLVEAIRILQQHDEPVTMTLLDKYWERKIWLDGTRLNLAVILHVEIQNAHTKIYLTPQKHFGYIPNGQSVYENFASASFAKDFDPLFRAQGFLLLGEQAKLTADLALIKEGKLLNISVISQTIQQAHSIISRYANWYVPTNSEPNN